MFGRVDKARLFLGIGAPKNEHCRPRALIDQIHAEAIRLDADKTLILDVPPEQGLERAAARGGDARFESMGLDFHRELRSAFLSIAESDPERCTVIDSTQAKDTVLAQALLALNK